MASNRNSADDESATPTSIPPPKQASDQQKYFSSLNWAFTGKRSRKGTPSTSPKTPKNNTSSEARIPVDKPATTTKTQSDSSSSSSSSSSSCEPTFISPKAMYGHLRWHSQRERRGLINPPRKTTALSPTNAPPPTLPQTSDQQNLSPPKFSITGIRRRPEKTTFNPNVGGHGDNQYSPTDRDVLFGAYDLFFLANGCDHPSYAANVLTTSSSSAEPDPTNMDSQKITSTDQAVEINKDPKMQDLETKKTCRCSICSKPFASHHVLGGHMKSHKLKNKNEMDTEAAGKVSEHRCKICTEMYPSGQALGGHMRRHYGGPCRLIMGRRCCRLKKKLCRRGMGVRMGLSQW